MNKLIKISECHYIIASDEKIVEGDYYWDSLVSHWAGVGILQMVGYAGETIIQSSAGTTSPISTSMKVTHSTFPMEENKVAYSSHRFIFNKIEKINMSECIKIEYGFDIDLEKLSSEMYGTLENGIGAERRLVFQEGFRKALEILGNRKYSEEDMRSCWYESKDTDFAFNGYIQSLQQTEWIVETFDGECRDGEIKLEVITNPKSQRPPVSPPPPDRLIKEGRQPIKPKGIN